MKNFTLLLAGVAITMAACKKDNHTIDVPSLAKADTDKPLASVSRALSNSDTYQAAFFYNGIGSLTKLLTSGVESGNAFSRQLNVLRNSNNIISAFQTDVITGQLTYDYSTRHYVYAIITDTQRSATDSVYYVYSGDNITIRTTYTRNFNAAQYHLLHTTTFGYNAAGNIVNVAEYKFISGRAVEVERMTFTYDEAINPLPLYDENIILALERLLPAGKNNLLTAAEDLGSQAEAYVESSNYNYSTLKKTLSGKITASNGITGVIAYSY
jgi:hypothetical protein